MAKYLFSAAEPCMLLFECRQLEISILFFHQVRQSKFRFYNVMSSDICPDKPVRV